MEVNFDMLCLSSKEVTQLLRISTRTLQNYRADGRIKFYKISRKNILYPVKDVYELMQKSSLPSILKDRAAYSITEYLKTQIK